MPSSIAIALISRDLGHNLTAKQEFLLREDFDEGKIKRAKDGKFAAKEGRGGGGTGKAGGGGGGAPRGPQLKSPANQKAAGKVFKSVAGDPRYEPYRDVFGRTYYRKKATKADYAIAIGAVAVYMGAMGALVSYDIKQQKKQEAQYENFWGYNYTPGGGKSAKDHAKEEEKKVSQAYEALGVDKDADYETVKKAYKAKAKTYHPDVNKDPGAEDAMKGINDAFDQLDQIYEKEGRKPRRDYYEQFIVEMLREDFVEEKHARDLRGRFAPKKNGSGSLSRSRSKTAAKAITGTAAATIGVAAIAGIYIGVEGRRAMDDISDFEYIGDQPVDFSRYDDLEPGTMIYKGFEVPNLSKKGKGLIHYSVYMGKDPETGEHMTIQCNADPKNPGTVSIIPISIEKQFDAIPKAAKATSSHYKPVPPEKMNPGGSKYSKEEVLQRAEALIGQPYKYGLTRDNCENIARVIVEGESKTTQGQKVTKPGKQIGYSLMNTFLEKNRNKSRPSDPAKTAKEMADLLAMRHEEEIGAELNRVKSEWEAKAVPPNAKPGSERAFRESFFNKVFQDSAKGERKRTDSQDDEATNLLSAMKIKSPERFAATVEETAAACGDKATSNLVRRQLWTAYFELLITTLSALDKGTPKELRRDRYKRYILDQLNQDFTEALHPRDSRGRFAKKSERGGPRFSSAATLGQPGGGGGTGRNRLSKAGITALSVGVPVVGGVGVAAAIGLGASALYQEGNKGASDISAMTFPDPSKEYDFSQYDDFEPGEMIRKAFTVPGQPIDKGFLHYAVYKGKDPKTGEHMVIHAVPDPKDPAGTVAIVEQSIEDAVKRGGKAEMHWHSYYQAVPEDERIKGEDVPTKAEALKRAESLIGQPYDYYSVRSNCESFARLVTEGIAYETQGPTASERGKDFVARMTKRMLDKARETSPVWQGSTPKDAYEYARILAQMQSGELSDQVKSELAANRERWQSAPNIPVSKPTNQTLAQIMGWTLNKLDTYEQKTSRRRADNDDFYAATGLKTPDQYAALISEVVAEAKPVLRSQIEAYLWSNYLQMTIALIKGKAGRVDSHSFMYVFDLIRSDFKESEHLRDNLGRFATNRGGKRRAAIATVAGLALGGTVLAGGALTLAGAAMLYESHRPGDSFRGTLARTAVKTKARVTDNYKKYDQVVEDFLASNKVPNEARKTLENLHGEVRLQAGKLLGSPGYKKVGHDKKTGITEMRNKEGSILFLSRVGNQVISFNANVSPIPFGQIVADGAPTYNVGFQVNGDYTSDAASSASSKEIIKKVRQCWNKGIEALPDNALLESSAYDGDGKGKRRASIYKRMGYQYLPGRTEGVMYAQKKDGKLQKLSQEQMDIFAEELSNFDSVASPRKLYQVLKSAGKRVDWEESHHPRDEKGRFSSKGKALLSSRPNDPTQVTLGNGSVTTGEAGKIVSAGRSYSDRLLDDPDIAEAQARMESAKAKMNKINDKLRGADPKTITAAQLEASAKAGAECTEAYTAYMPTLTKKMAALRDELKNDSGISRQQAEKIVRGKSLVSVPPGFTARAQLREDLTDYVQLTGNDLPTLKKAIVATKLRGRSFADPRETKSIYISGDTFNRGTIFHETTHHLEYNNPKLVKSSEEWAKKRSDGKGEQELRDFLDPSYGPGEKAFRDAYIHGYAGKVYRRSDGSAEATEVLSMGMQFFDSPDRMARLYILDPDHFNYTLGAIRPNGRMKKDTYVAEQQLIDWLRQDVFDPGRHPRDAQGRFVFLDGKDGKRSMGVWYKGRRTGVLSRASNRAEAIKNADKSKKRGGVVDVVRQLTAEEEKVAQSGRWLRTGPKGEKPGELTIRGHGPKPKNYAGKP